MDYKYRLARYKEIVSLKKLGWTGKRIGEHLKVSPSRVNEIAIGQVPIEHRHFGLRFNCLACNKLEKSSTGNFKFCRKCSFDLREIEGRERTREMVRIRDKHKCKDCNKKWIEGNRKYDIHHINGLCGKKSRSYDKVSERGDMITLCHRCHFNRPEHTTKRRALERSNGLSPSIPRLSLLDT